MAGGGGVVLGSRPSVIGCLCISFATGLGRGDKCVSGTPSGARAG